MPLVHQLVARKTVDVLTQFYRSLFHLSFQAIILTEKCLVVAENGAYKTEESREAGVCVLHFKESATRRAIDCTTTLPLTVFIQ